MVVGPGGQASAMSNDANDSKAPSQPATDDPYTEGPNSTVDDWLGQKVEQDSELADRLVAQEDGDLQKAEEKFNQQSNAAAADADDQPRRV